MHAFDRGSAVIRAFVRSKFEQKTCLRCGDPCCGWQWPSLPQGRGVCIRCSAAILRDRAADVSQHEEALRTFCAEFGEPGDHFAVPLAADCRPGDLVVANYGGSLDHRVLLSWAVGPLAVLATEACEVEKVLLTSESAERGYGNQN